MTKWRKAEYDATAAHLEQLCGKTVKAVCADPNMDGDWVIFGLEFTDGTIAWICANSECDEPGFIDIEDLK